MKNILEIYLAGYSILCAIVVLGTGLNAARHLRAGELVTGGMLTEAALMPFETLCVLVIGAAVLLKMCRDRREETE